MFRVQRTISSSDKNTSKKYFQTDWQKYNLNLADTMYLVQGVSLDDWFAIELPF